MVLPLVLVAGLASPSRADRLSIGASVGSSEGKGGTDRISTRSVFGRIGLFGRLSIEGELGAMTRDNPNPTLQNIDTPTHPRPLGRLPGIGNDGDGWDSVRASATLRYDLAGKGPLIPHLLAGVGAERWGNPLARWDYGHREIGAGLDLVVTGGLRLGVDLRAGKRDMLASQTRGDILLLYIPAPYSSEDAKYVAGRITIAATF